MCVLQISPFSYHFHFWSHDQHIEMVTLMPRFPLSANNCAMVVSKTKQSEFIMAEETPSWIDLGVASHVNLLR